MIKKACEDPKIETYDMSGLAFGDNIDEKSANIKFVFCESSIVTSRKFNGGGLKVQWSATDY